MHTDGESAPMIMMNVHIESMIAISSDGADIMVHGGVLNGTVDVDSAIANLYDVSPTSNLHPLEKLEHGQHTFST